MNKGFDKEKQISFKNHLKISNNDLITKIKP
jgi:hypothetical protein